MMAPIMPGCKLTCCHVPFKGFFFARKIFSVSSAGSRGNTQLPHTVRRVNVTTQGDSIIVKSNDVSKQDQAITKENLAEKLQMQLAEKK